MFTELLDLCKAKKPKIPRKYLSGLKGKEREDRKKELERRARAGGGSYKEIVGDDSVKTKPSKYSKTKLAKEVREEMEGNSKKDFINAVHKITGISKKILNEVHERGAKAWATGHRAGASQIAWSRARVYSFATGGKTQKTADADLWREHNENKRS